MTGQNVRDPLTEKIIFCSFKVHNTLGLGFTEKIYHHALMTAFEQERLNYETEKPFPVFFENKKVGSGRLDLVVENKVIVEIKAVQGYIPKIFHYQIMSYLRASGLKTGLLINFGNKSCEIKRFVV